MSTYRTEMLIPISRDNRSFEERQRDEMERVLDTGGLVRSLRDDWHSEMERRMEQRRRRWEQDIAQMRDEFFQLRPMEPPLAFGSTMGESFKRQPNAFDQMQTLFERGEDGQVHFQIRFDVRDFNPEDISVTTRDRKVTVTAKHEIKTSTSTSSREFSRSIDLPKNVDDNRMTCVLTNDRILLLDAPVKAPDFPGIDAITHSGRGNSSPSSPHRPQSTESLSTTTTSGSSSSPRSTRSLIESSNPIVTLATGEKRFRFEIPLGNDYSPDEITVKTQNQRVCIHARHEEKSASRSSFREFSKEYDIPPTVDPFDVSAKFENGILMLDAPVRLR